MDVMRIEIEQSDRLCILHCKGRLVAGQQMEYMLAKMDDVKRLACDRVLADFDEVLSIGSAGVTFIVGVYTAIARKPEGRFVLAGVNPLVQQVLDLTGLSTLIPQATDLESGLAMLQADAPTGPFTPPDSASAKV